MTAQVLRTPRSPIVTIGLARLYLHEHIDRLRQAGIAAVFLGVVVISAA